MTILNWKGILTRILAGLVSLPDLNEYARNKLDHLIKKLESDEKPDLKEYRDVIQGDEIIKEALKKK